MSSGSSDSNEEAKECSVAEEPAMRAEAAQQLYVPRTELSPGMRPGQASQRWKDLSWIKGPLVTGHYLQPQHWFQKVQDWTWPTDTVSGVEQEPSFCEPHQPALSTACLLIAKRQMIRGHSGKEFLLEILRNVLDSVLHHLVFLFSFFSVI